MSAVTAAARPLAARDTIQTEREVLTRIARGGLLIAEDELYYQLQRHGVKPGQAPGLLADLQQRGLIESQTHYRLTPAGAELVPAGDRPAPAGISPTRWSSPHSAAARDRAHRAPAGAPRGTPGRVEGQQPARIPLPGLAAGGAGRR